MGPFELWDAYGVKEAVEHMGKEGLTIPANVKEMLTKGNFRNPAGSIQKTVGSHFPGKFPAFVIPFENAAYFFF